MLPKIKSIKTFKKTTFSILNLFQKKTFVNNYKHSVFLRSMPKSGTIYLRLLLTNYFYNLQKAENGEDEFIEINYDFMQYDLFPNIRSAILTGKKEYLDSGFKIKSHGKILYNDFIYDHGCALDWISYLPEPKKTILLYRNPYDNLISKFYYSYKNRLGKEQKYDHPREIIESYIPRFAKTYCWMKKYSQDRPNVIFVSYEELKLSTKSTLTHLLEFLEIPVYDKLVCFSMYASSIKKVKQHEIERGKPIHSPKQGLKGSFIRSGAIGQWKKHFEKDDLSKINTILIVNDIDINEFIIQE